MPKRCILILLDGLSDRAYPILGNKTPLASAHTPAMDLIVKKGLCGLMFGLKPGISLPSEIAHFNLFGFEKEFPGRGPLEALGAGIKLDSSEVVFLARFAGVKREGKNFVVVNNSPHISQEEQRELLHIINEFSQVFLDKKVKISYVPITSQRGLLILKGEVSPFVSDADPLQENLPVLKVEPLSPEDSLSKNTAKILNDFMVKLWRLLEESEINKIRSKSGKGPVNFLLIHRGGRLKKIQKFSERWGLKPTTISSGIIYWGIGKYLGFHVEKMEEYGDPEKELDERLSKAKRLVKEFDFIHVHHKGPDSAAHKKDPVLKKEIIEALDRAISKHLDWLLSPENLVIITSDHATPSSGKMIHSGEPVPVVFCGEGVWQDQVTTFSEIECAKGALGIIPQDAFMFLVLNYLDRGILWGMKYGREERYYYPSFTGLLANSY